MVENKKYIGVDIGGTNLRVGLVKGDKIVRYVKKNTPKTREEFLKCLVDSINEIIDGEKNVMGIGVGSPGPLKDGVIQNPPNLPLKNFNLKKFLKNEFKIRVEVINDANCVAISEAKFGCKKKNFIILTLGTGIGGGVIIDGKLYKGDGYAGELGHIIIHDGKDLEYYWKKHRLDCKECFGREMLIKDLLKMKEENAEAILDSSAKYLGQGIASLVVSFDPEIVILMGGARETGERFLKLIRRYTQKYSILPKKTPIIWSKLEHPGILGASLVVR